MKKRLTILRSSLAKTFATRRDVLVGIALAVAAFALFVLVPVWTGPKDAVGGFALLGSSVMATLGCASCYSSLLSAFGLGGVIFFGKYGAYVSAAVVAVSFYAVWMTAKRIEGQCTRCVN
jgi:hypothetical protein